MTETAWDTANDPEPMFAHLRASSVPISDRRIWLFALACCVRVRRFFAEPQLQAALLFAEQHSEHGVYRQKGCAELITTLTRWYSEELAGERNRWLAQKRTPRFCQLLIQIGSCMAAERLLKVDTSRDIQSVHEIVADSTAWERAVQIDPEHPPLWDKARQAPERAAQADLLRDVFGNPFRPVELNSAWRTETVGLLANGIHADRAYDRLPILADALEEAGCDNAELLNHLRGLGPHVFGCWALDLVRGCY